MRSEIFSWCHRSNTTKCETSSERESNKHIGMIIQKIPQTKSLWKSFSCVYY